VIDLDAAIAEVQQQYCAAAYERDAARFMQIYDDSVRVFDAWGEWEYAGAEAWRRAVEGWFQSLGTERVRVTFEETRSFGSAAGAFSSSIVTYAGLAADGAPLRAMQNRLSWGLRTRGHVLRVLHEHTSAPVGFEDMKAILHRKGKP
jgi:ketosteroid isomerase-like protein